MKILGFLLLWKNEHNEKELSQEHVESGTTYQRNDYLTGKTKQIPSQVHKNENSRPVNGESVKWKIRRKGKNLDEVHNKDVFSKPVLSFQSDFLWEQTPYEFRASEIRIEKSERGSMGSNLEEVGSFKFPQQENLPPLTSSTLQTNLSAICSKGNMWQDPAFEHFALGCDGNYLLIDVLAFGLPFQPLAKPEFSTALLETDSIAENSFVRNNRVYERESMIQSIYNPRESSEARVDDSSSVLNHWPYESTVPGLDLESKWQLPHERKDQTGPDDEQEAKGLGHPIQESHALRNLKKMEGKQGALWSPGPGRNAQSKLQRQSDRPVSLTATEPRKHSELFSDGNSKSLQYEKYLQEKYGKTGFFFRGQKPEEAQTLIPKYLITMFSFPASEHFAAKKVTYFFIHKIDQVS
ncbi:hypothetical protein MJG53_005282 [Ovis ammon polii x Ovis aries]|uniref:Uncharacterized protein n=1 Tax=Ovis ammon polii x Ovis aries TaxID=2918886 RepID=A0ACB9VCI5_9CETA|nr:hypothetical protein MJG53_005282 [Ovis ammon polii x Ovis aries]